MECITFAVRACPNTGGFVARWDDPAGGGITTQGETMAELEAMLRDAVEGYFFDRPRPARVRLHFIDDPELALAASAQSREEPAQ
jgi:predicted RNase H-like HicB family nuclease